MAKQKKLPDYMRASDAEEVEEFRKQTDDGLYDLLAHEIWWRDRSELLEEHGYRLRPRLRPGWVPSWQGTDLNPTWCEDSIVGGVSCLLFALPERLTMYSRD